MASSASGPTRAKAYLQRLYLGLMGREYDPVGLSFFNADPTTDVEVAAAFLRSPEYAATGKPATVNADFITALYRGFGGRDPSADELASWLRPGAPALDAATVVSLFAQSPEAKAHDAPFTAKVFARSDAGTLLHDIYQTGLGREVELGGLANWAGQLAAGYGVADVVRRLTLEPEYQAKTAGLTDAAFFTTLFTRGTGRAPTEAELAAAVSRLAAGTARSVLQTEIALAPETRAHLTRDDFGQPPVLAPAADMTVAEGAAGSIALSATAPATATVGVDTFAVLGSNGLATGWSVQWGDGTATVSLAGDGVTTAHDYALPGHYLVLATATTADGTFAAAPVPVTAVAGSFHETAVLAEATGFHARFDGVIDPNSLSVVADAVGVAPSVVVTAPAGGLVAGSVIPDADGAGFRFISASGVLPAGSYGVTVRGTLRDARGDVLDGNDDGAAGDDARTVVTLSGDVTSLLVPSFMRGPGQGIDVPETAPGAGLPVAFTSAGGATAVAFSVVYDPALLSVTGALPGAGVPEGGYALLSTRTLADGRMEATVTVNSPTPIAAGTVALAMLQASVPGSAPYGAKEALTVAIVSVNGVPQALPASAAAQVVGYLGDADGDGAVTGADATRILRVVGGADRSFAVWSGVADTVVADADNDGAVTAADAALVQTLPVPSGLTLVTGSAAPFVSAPLNLPATAGAGVTVPVTVDRSVVLANGSITLSFDPAALELTAVRADPTSGLVVSDVSAASGTVTVTVGRGTAAPTSGVLALFDFTVAPGVPPGTGLALDLRAVSLDGTALLASQPGPDGTDGSLLVEPGLSSTGLSSTGRTRLARAALLGGQAA